MRSLLSIVATAFLAAVAVRGADVPAIGTMAPQFRLPSQDGTPVALSDFRGKWVVPYF